MKKLRRDTIEWELFATWIILTVINKLWLKEEILANIAFTTEITWLLMICYGFKSQYKWLHIASYIWRVLLIATLLFVWWNYFFNS